MKVTVYVREHSTRKYRKAESFEPAGTTYVLRYGSTWETIEAKSRSEATVAALRKQIDLEQGVVKLEPKRAISKPKPTELMLDVAIDEYLTEIQQQRKPKTHAAYATTLKYFYDSIGGADVFGIVFSFH